MQMVQPAIGYYSRKNHIQKGREWERGSGGGEREAWGYGISRFHQEKESGGISRGLGFRP